MIQSFEPAPVSRKARVEIIPLIDVVFFLLATFVLFTLALNKLKVLPTQLPYGVSHPEITADDLLYVQAIGPEMFFWREGRFGTSERLSLKDLKRRLAEYCVRVKAPRVAVSGNEHVTFGATILLLDEVRSAGVKQIALETNDHN